MSRYLIVISIILVSSLFATACRRSVEDPSPGDPPDIDGRFYTHRIAHPTEYYSGGPQQARPPDGRLEAGSKARILREAGSYILIETETGLEAYVATGALEPLSPGNESGEPARTGSADRRD